MPEHHVTQGDTLSAIAQQYDVSENAIRSNNPQITDRNHIEIGWTLAIPEKAPGTGTTTATAMPEPKTSNPDCSTETTATPCQSELTDVIHITGASDDQWCMAIPEAAAEQIHTEIDEMQLLMLDFKKAQDQESEDPEQASRKKREWMIKAAEKGVIAPAKPDKTEEQQTPSKTAHLQSQIAAIDEQIVWYDQEYDPGYFFSFISDADDKREDILTRAKAHRLDMLRNQRNALQEQLTSEEKQARPVKRGVRSDDFSGRSNRAEAGLVEVMVFSQPGRWHYVRKRVMDRILAGYASIRYIRKTRGISAALEDQSGTAGQLLGKIKEDIQSDAQKSAIGKIEATFVKTNEQHYLLGEEHSALKWSSSNGKAPSETQFQASAEAQLMRFAMQASAGVNEFNLEQGEIDVGVKAGASLSLAEAEAKLAEISIPNEAGWDCRFTYRNRNGELSDLAFGAFKLSGDMTLNCFVGGRVSGQANARVSAGAPTFLLSDRKTVEPNPQTGLAVTGNAFAGAEAGGALAGRFQWVHPDDQHKDTPPWQELVKIEAGATLAIGVGAGLDFELGLRENTVIFAGRGKLVFGPGGSGTFGTTVGVDSVWNLLTTVVEVLEASEFQFLSNIEPKLFDQWAKSLFLGLTSQAEDVHELLTSPDIFEALWFNRQSRKADAEALAKNIKEQARQAGSPDRMIYKGIPFRQLPPETLGMMLHTLTETFVESWEEDQETAILIVISSINQWRHFFETLQHMSAEGEKTNAMGSLERICAILDDGSETDQLSQFHRWIMSNLSTTPELTEQDLAWQKVPVRRKKHRVTQRLAMMRDQANTLA